MATSLLEKQLEPVTAGREKMTRVRVGKGAVVVLSERFFDQVQPLLDYMASQPEGTAPAGINEWTEEKNAQRAALIKKKYKQGLTAAEKRELKTLQQEGERFADQLTAPHNEMLELMLLGLEQKIAQQKTPR